MEILQPLIFITILILTSQLEVKDETTTLHPEAGELGGLGGLGNCSEPCRLEQNPLRLRDERRNSDYFFTNRKSSGSFWVDLKNQLSSTFLTNVNNSSNGGRTDPQDEADPVSRTSRPALSPEDPLVEFDQQQIVMLADDEVVRAAAASLYHKHPAVSSLHTVPPQHRVRQVKGQAAPLSERSSLVLVGHGAREPSGEMRISGYSYQDVARIIQSGSRIGQKIQTTAVVACGVGSDHRFPQALLQTLHEAGLETELHLWKTAVQVAETGDVLSQDGGRWRSGDHTNKLVLTVGPTGEIRRRDDGRRTGQEVPTNLMALLGNGGKKDNKAPKPTINRSLVYQNSWPPNPETFINQNVFGKINQNRIDELKLNFKELEGLTWGMFHSDQPTPKRVDVNDPDYELNNYVLGKRDKVNNRVTISWMNNEEDKKNMLKECYLIKSGSDIRNIIRHFAKDGENEITYLMVNNWIYEVDPQSLYVFPVGKELDNNQKSKNVIKNIKENIEKQMNKESYTAIRYAIKEEHSTECVQYFKNIFLGETATIPSPEREAWCTTYFTASVISESARNFRTFPLTLMALDMDDNRFWFNDDYITMATGGTWLNTELRGFSGAAGGEEGKLEKLAALLGREYRTISNWQKKYSKDQNEEARFLRMYEIAENFTVLKSEEKEKFIRDCQTFFDAVKNQQNLPSGSGSSKRQ